MNNDKNKPWPTPGFII